MPTRIIPTALTRLIDEFADSNVANQLECVFRAIHTVKGSGQLQVDLHTIAVYIDSHRHRGVYNIEVHEMKDGSEGLTFFVDPEFGEHGGAKWWVGQIQTRMPDALGHKANHDVVFSGSPLHEIEFDGPRPSLDSFVKMCI